LVVSRLACPSQLRITVTSTSAVTRLTAVACLNLCGDTLLLTREGTFLPAAAAYCFNLKRTPEALRGFPYRFTKMGSSSRRGFLFKRAFRSSTVSGQRGQIRSFLPLPNRRTWKGDSKRRAWTERSNAS